MSRLLNHTGTASKYLYHYLGNEGYRIPLPYAPIPPYLDQETRTYWSAYFSGWPSGGLRGGDAPAQTIIASGMYDPYRQGGYSASVGGGGGHLKISGVTKDSTGTPIPNALVQLFHTSDDAFVMQTTSDGAGNYVVYTPYGDGHYCVAYLAGSPDVAGTTVNTLVGT